jgi:dipeptidyl aminopeptidase/acylaminoacyl peptidase
MLLLSLPGASLLDAETASGPTGKLAYLHDDELWVKVFPSGASRQVSQGGALAPEWSASGQWLAFRQKQKVIVIPATDATGATITLQTNGKYLWSPAQDELVFTEPNGLSVIRFDSNSSEKIIVLSSTASDRVSHFAWSRDGKTVAMTLSNQMVRPDDQTSHVLGVNSDGVQVKRIVSADRLSPDEPIADILPAGWSLDVQHLLI